MAISEKLQKVLSPKQKKLGYRLEEDDHSLKVLHHGEIKAVFNASEVTKEEIRQTVDELIKGRK